ncbi:MAG TPA: hypothetical protein PL044_06420 [Clostridiales bacterium]|nr:hypothetical protein [Clostridiales bacterium]HQH62277.1 hypothetical protein [Clostridiales bacterium]HQK73391.1 hypothetical protein [Clostridiales bacterium]
MGSMIKFLEDFLSQLFVKGIWGVIKGIGLGIANIFNIPAYIDIFKAWKNDFSAGEWVLAILCMLLIVALLAGLVLLLVFLFKKYVRFRKTIVNQEELLNEVASLNRDVIKLTTEKEKILAMKVSQLGLKPGENPYLDEEETAEKGETEGDENAADEDYSRFYKLTQVDLAIQDYVPPEYNDTITLPEICSMFRNFACSRMGLYYEEKIIRLFIAAFATTRLIILQGISGTGKTSLPYAFGKFIKNDVTIASVQPSWRDRTELFGYFNEFTKRFNETEVLKKMYEATYKDDIFIVIMDEMNIARVEYYFAELLSILEMPSRDEWVVSLVPSVWPTDPKHLFDGKLRLPENMWYVGTINNDDSTFAVTDKVYDRAIPIDINSKGKYFDAPWTDHLILNYKHLEAMFEECKVKHKVSEDSLRKLAELDDYVIEHFRLAFGNRIVKQLQDFVPAYVGCGGTEIDGLDFVLCHKILRKFESLNLSFIRDEIGGLITYLNKNFGKSNMKESKEYLERLQRLI